MVAPKSVSSFKGHVAVVQAEPAWLDLAASVEKTCKMIEEAASNGAQLLAFPECFIPGYPTWIWSRPVDFDLASRYIKNSLRRDSPEMDAIRACVAQNNLTVSLGMSENDKNSLYIAQCTIGPDGEIQMWRRKLKPTHMERTIFGDSSGSSLNNVVDTPVGRVGALSCWEHLQPLLKYHTLHQHEEVHVSGWPPVFPHAGGPGLWSMSREGCRGLSQTYAIESQTFVLHSTGVQSSKAVELLGTGSSPLFGRPGGGSSAVFGPDGRQLSEDVDETKEAIIYADLDENQILSNKGFVDCVGHYSRPDLLWLGVDAREKKHIVVGQEREVNGK